MLFNSFSFLIFFSITYSIYLCCNHRWQNRVLLLASYIFYAAWDYRFLALICFSSAVDFVVGGKIHQSTSGSLRKIWLTVSVATNLAILGFFKYYNFFVDGLADLFSWFGFAGHNLSLHIILPVGISFYTFRTLSYTIDIYRKKLTPTGSIQDYALYVSFFPLLVAGPIERAANLLPQMSSKRTITAELIRVSSFLFLFGLFEKTVVADNLAVIVNSVYDGRQSDGVGVLIATYGFAFQIFADFDGYSNMAKGLAGLMGIKIINNFNAPYFSETPSDFWKRWHISLSSWLRDYLYIPLGGNRGGTIKTAGNLFITMLLAGLWHGAGWMFVLWGIFHGVLLIIFLPLKESYFKLPSTLRRVLFFHLICFGWMLFRTPDIEQFSFLVKQLFYNFQLTFDAGQLLMIKKFLLYSAVPIIYQYLQYRSEKLYPIFDWPIIIRAFSYVFLFYMIMIFGFNNAQSFIYAQF